MCLTGRGKIEFLKVTEVEVVSALVLAKEFDVRGDEGCF